MPEKSFQNAFLKSLFQVASAVVFVSIAFLISQRKLRETAQACRQDGLVFLPFAMETLGGFHAGAVTQAKQIASTLARKSGQEESVVTSQLFGRLSLNLMRGNALLLSSWLQVDCPPHADGIM